MQAGNCQIFSFAGNPRWSKVWQKMGEISPEQISSNSWDYHIFQTLYCMQNFSLLEVGKMMGCCWVGGFLVENNVKLLVHLASWNLPDFEQKVVIGYRNTHKCYEDKYHQDKCCLDEYLTHLGST